MKSLLAFDDVLITPSYSNIKSRAEVNTKVTFLGEIILPIISSNMDTVTGPEMAVAMVKYGGMAALHRFWSIERNVQAFKDSLYGPGDNIHKPIVSIGLGGNELERAKALYNVGANKFLIDVAHGASEAVVDQTRALRETLGQDVYIIVGNFATAESVKMFLRELGEYRIDAIKVGIGGGSACTTRKVTGCGWPTFASVLDCSSLGIPVIADGGIRGSGDVCKALAAGATVVMCGKLLAGSDEAPGKSWYIKGSIKAEVVSTEQAKLDLKDNYDFYHRLSDPYNTSGGFKIEKAFDTTTHKQYRGSASKESYQAQNKESTHRTPEGEAFLVPYTGPVKNTLQQLEAGLRSSMSYVGASNLKEYRDNVEFVKITEAGHRESSAHGKNK